VKEYRSFCLTGLVLGHMSMIRWTFPMAEDPGRGDASSARIAFVRGLK